MDIAGRSQPDPPHDATAIRPAIERFLATARLPAVLEPGANPIPIDASSFALTGTAVRPVLECWSATHVLSRRIAAVHSERRGRIELRTEHFGGRRGTLVLIDLAHPAHVHDSLRSQRLHFREQLRLALHRQYPGWRVEELSSDPDLEHSLSPAYPRALLVKGSGTGSGKGSRKGSRKGTIALAAIGAPEHGPSPDSALTFGLIWLDYLRRREPRLSIGGLLVFVPIGSEINTCHRVRHLDPARLTIAVFVHGHGLQVEEAVKPADYTNFSTCVEQPRSLPCTSAGYHPRHHPEAALERIVRAHIDRLDGTLLPQPVYSQAPAIASAHRGILDLLAVDFRGRLAVIELKASEDIHLPLQALDYWMRVRWHLERGDFARAGYFPGITVLTEPPRLILAAPALAFHPSTATILSYFAPSVEVERIGLGLEWRRELKVAFRTCGSSNN